MLSRSLAAVLALSSLSLLTGARGCDPQVPIGESTHLITPVCGIAGGEGRRIGLYGMSDGMCGGDPTQPSLSITLPPSEALSTATDGTTITSTPTTTAPTGSARACAGDGLPCRESQDFTVVLDSYTDGAGAAGTYTVRWPDGSSSTGAFDAAWCEPTPRYPCF